MELKAKDIMDRLVTFPSVSRASVRGAGNWGGANPALQVKPSHLMNAASGQGRKAQYSAVIGWTGDPTQLHISSAFSSVEQCRATGTFKSHLVDSLAE